MDPLAHKKPSLSDSTSRCADLFTLAERELSAFFRAITQLFGSEEARLSAEEWLQELIEINGLPASTREWRLITAKVSARLARRAGALSLAAEPQIA